MDYDKTQLDQFKKFLAVLMGDFQYGFLSQQSKTKKPHYLHYPFNRQDGLPVKNLQDGYGTHYSIFPYDALPAANCTSDDIAAVSCFYCEFDLKDKPTNVEDFAWTMAALREKCEKLDPPPSVIINSGGGFHCYWLLDKPILKADFGAANIKERIRAWVMTHGGDEQSSDLHRQLRVPGFKNFKYSHQPLVVFVKNDLTLRYSLETLASISDKWLEEHPKPVYIPTPYQGPTGNKRNHPYVLTAIDNIVSAVSTAVEPNRHDTLRDKSIILGHFVQPDVLTMAEATTLLIDACMINGQLREEKKTCELTIKSGLEIGAKEPYGFQNHNNRTPKLGVLSAVTDDTPGIPATPDAKPYVSDDIEKIVLSYALGGYFKEVSKYADARYFARPHNRKIWAAIMEVYQTNTTITHDMVWDRLRDVDRPYFDTIRTAEYEHSELQTYLDSLQSKYIARRLHQMGTALHLMSANQENLDAPVLLASARSEIEKIRLLQPTEHHTVLQVVRTLSERLQSEKPELLFKFGLPIDRYIKVTEPLLIVVAGKPGTGKTTFLLQIAINVIREYGSVFFESLEMSPTQFGERLMGNVGGVNTEHIRTGLIDIPSIPALEQESAKWSAAVRQVAELQQRGHYLYVDQTVSMHPLHFRQRLEEMKEITPNIRLALADYLTMFSPVSGENAATKVASISNSLRDTCKSVKLPLIVAAQLNREVERRGEQRPQLSDLKHTGDIEQDADVVILLWYEDQAELEKPVRKLKATIAKNRYGSPHGEIDLRFNTITQTITEWTE